MTENKKYGKCGCVEGNNGVDTEAFLCTQCGYKKNSAECKKEEREYYLYKEV